MWESWARWRELDQKKSSFQSQIQMVANNPEPGKRILSTEELAVECFHLINKSKEEIVVNFVLYKPVQSVVAKIKQWCSQNAKKKKKSIHVMICYILGKSLLTFPTILLSIFNPSLWMTKLSLRKSKLSWERKCENTGQTFLNDGADNSKGSMALHTSKDKKGPWEGRTGMCLVFPSLQFLGLEHEVQKYRDMFLRVGLRR